jgi:hypothetical protein
MNNSVLAFSLSHVNKSKTWQHKQQQTMYTFQHLIQITVTNFARLHSKPSRYIEHEMLNCFLMCTSGVEQTMKIFSESQTP